MLPSTESSWARSLTESSSCSCICCAMRLIDRAMAPRSSFTRQWSCRPSCPSEMSPTTRASSRIGRQREDGEPEGEAERREQADGARRHELPAQLRDGRLHVRGADRQPDHPRRSPAVSERSRDRDVHEIALDRVAEAQALADPARERLGDLGTRRVVVEAGELALGHLGVVEDAAPLADQRDARVRRLRRARADLAEPIACSGGERHVAGHLLDEPCAHQERLLDVGDEVLAQAALGEDARHHDDRDDEGREGPHDLQLDARHVGLSWAPIVRLRAARAGPLSTRVYGRSVVRSCVPARSGPIRERVSPRTGSPRRARCG